MSESKINYCKWCGAKTSMEKMQLPDSPILSFLEEKINKLGRDKVWGENSNWAFLDLDPNDEAELLVYDEMLNNITLKHVCESCIEEDNKLYDKYYEDKHVSDENNY
jgi:hypothetical protein